MIVEEFYIEDLDLLYFVGLCQLDLQKSNLDLDSAFKVIDSIQKKNNQVVIQLFNDEYILNEDHVYSAIYFVQKAFANNTNISQSKNIEFLLYLSANRQIINALKYFGVTNELLLKKRIPCCIISSENNCEKIMKEVEEQFKTKECDVKFESLTSNKLEKIKNFYKFNKEQIKIILESHGIKQGSLNTLYSEPEIAEKVLLDLICEEMALLSLEKVSLE
ncbi:MAG: KEOPS complex subunit Cgi121 [Promethearchaeota archaeon]